MASAVCCLSVCEFVFMLIKEKGLSYQHQTESSDICNAVMSSLSGKSQDNASLRSHR